MKIEELFSVRGKVAVVTGGSRGLGEMIARAYVENGVKVYITARRAEACEQLAKELSLIGECIAIPADLSRMEEIDRFAGEIKKRENKLDILVNNAGASWGASFHEFPENGWDKVMDLNVKSVFFLTQRLLPLLEAAGSAESYARVINIGSIEGIRTSHLEAYSVCGVEGRGKPPDAYHGEVSGAQAHRGQCHRAGLFPVQDDGRDRRAGLQRRGRRCADEADGKSRRSGGHRTLSRIEGERLCLRCGHSGRWRACNDGLMSRRMGLNLICDG